MSAVRSRQPSRAVRTAPFVVLAAVIVMGSYLRFAQLGTRSLWLDEFCTWHASSLSFSQSLSWEPELTIPPLYQLVLRAVTDDAHPSEWLLRLPAAVCGIMSIAAGYWLGVVMAGRAVGVSLASLVACNLLQIEYSQEARPYSMLVLGCTLSTTLWYQLVMDGRRRYAIGYVIAAVLTLHAHFLAGLTILAHITWWQGFRRVRPAECKSFLPWTAVGIVGALSAPIMLRTLSARSSVSQAVSWIELADWTQRMEVLQRITFGTAWILAIMIPAILTYGVIMFRRSRVGGNADDAVEVQSDSAVGLLLTCFAFAWAGLLVASVLIQPMTIARYALPAAVPALLLPLVVVQRLDRRLPAIIAGLFVLGTAPDWWNHGREIEPGFRELTKYVQEHLDRHDDAVVLTLDAETYPDWPEMERLALEYYPINDRPVYELPINATGTAPDESILEDPRTLYLIVFRAEPLSTLLAAGRKPSRIEHEGISYSRLLFSPYRLLRVAPRTAD